MKRILDEEHIRRAINRISNEILEKNENYEDIIFLGIIKRGNDIANRLSEKIYEIEGIRIPVYALNIRNFRDDIKDALKVDESIKLPDVDITDKNLIIVDDVMYTGRTARAALDAIVEMGRPSKVQLVAMIDRGHREFPIRADYVGKNIPTSRTENVKFNLMEEDGEDGVYIE